jgi:hypothetical protein
MTKTMQQSTPNQLLLTGNAKNLNVHHTSCFTFYTDGILNSALRLYNIFRSHVVEWQFGERLDLECCLLNCKPEADFATTILLDVIQVWYMIICPFA